MFERRNYHAESSIKLHQGLSKSELRASFPNSAIIQAVKNCEQSPNNSSERECLPTVRDLDHI